MDAVLGARHYDHFCFDGHWNDYWHSGGKLLPGAGGATPQGGAAGKGERMAQEQTKSLGITIRKIRHEGGRSNAWHHWGDHQLDPQ